MIKIAIPVENGRLNSHFGGSRYFTLIEVDQEAKSVLTSRTIEAPQHQPGLFPRWLREQGVRVVIASGIVHRALAIFAHHGIAVRAGLASASVEKLVTAYLNNELKLTPDGCEHHGHQHAHESEAGHHHRHGHHQARL